MLTLIGVVLGSLGVLLSGWGFYIAGNPNHYPIFPHGTVEEGDFGTGLDD